MRCLCSTDPIRRVFYHEGIRAVDTQCSQSFMVWLRIGLMHDGVISRDDRIEPFRQLILARTQLEVVARRRSGQAQFRECPARSLEKFQYSWHQWNLVES